MGGATKQDVLQFATLWYFAWIGWSDFDLHNSINHIVFYAFSWLDCKPIINTIIRAWTLDQINNSIMQIRFCFDYTVPCTRHHKKIWMIINTRISMFVNCRGFFHLNAFHYSQLTLKKKMAKGKWGQLFHYIPA